MTCGGCWPKYGTVWFDHDAKKWKHSVGDCAKPFPKAVEAAKIKPTGKVDS